MLDMSFMAMRREIESAEKFRDAHGERAEAGGAAG